MNVAAEILEALRAAGNKQVATAESITAGHLQSLLASVSGSSDVFPGGVTAYKPSVKIEQLGVDPDLADRTNCVDIEIARQMALGALKMFHSDYALATCGYAEVEERKPYAFYAIARAPAEILLSARVELAGSRIEAQKKAAQIVLERFLELLRNKAGDQ